MPGVKGARPPLPKPNTVRRKLWQSMRILRRFTVQDLLRTIPEGVKGASYNNAGKFVASLATHGVIVKISRNFRGGRAGDCQQYQIVRDSGPDYPVTCIVCKQFITATSCANKEKEKETEKETETEKGFAA